MIELEIYAAGIRDRDKILDLDHYFEALPGVRYKVDSNHDIVYIEADEPNFTVDEVKAAFEQIGLEAKVVGAVPLELQGDEREKTEQMF